MYMRAFQTAPSSPTIGASELVSYHKGEALTCRCFAFSSFVFGIYAGGGDHVSSGCPVADDAAAVSWKELWNTLDILYDEVALLPITSVSAMDQCLAWFHKEDHREVPEAVQAFLHAAHKEREGAAHLPTLRKRKLVVCPHYFAPEAKELASLCPLLSQRGKEWKAAAAIQSSECLRVLFDLSHVKDLHKLAVEMAWLLGYTGLQKKLYQDGGAGKPALVSIRFPFAHVPAVAELECAEKGPEGPSSMVATGLLRVMDFIAQHLLMVWEAGSWRSCLPRIGFVGQDVPVYEVLAEPSHPSSSYPALWVMSDEFTSASMSEIEAAKAEGNEACFIERVVVPLRELKEGEEEEWDPCTARERSRLNFCPCCGDHSDEADGHGHAHGH